MAVSLTDKVHVVRDSIPTSNLGSALANSGRDAVSIQEILELSSTFEVGTWTPGLSSYTGGSISDRVYVRQLGTYSVSGDLVTLAYDVEISSATITGAGHVILTGFPFAVNPSLTFSHVSGKVKGSLIGGVCGNTQFSNQGTTWSVFESGISFRTMKTNDLTITQGTPNSNLHFTGIVTFTKS